MMQIGGVMLFHFWFWRAMIYKARLGTYSWMTFRVKSGSGKKAGIVWYVSILTS